MEYIRQTKSLYTSTNFFSKNLIYTCIAYCLLICNEISLQAQVSITATGGDSGPTAYTTLKDAFDAINLGIHLDSITIDIIGNTTEAETAALNASGTGSSSYTGILMKPDGGAARTITGNIIAGNPLIDFIGAGNITVDGLNTGGNSLTFSNTRVSSFTGTSTIRFQADATHNIITRCSILGSTTVSDNTPGGNIYFAASSVTTGNDHITISHCNIGPAGSNLPSKCIYSRGTSNNDPGTANSGIVITENNIYDYFGSNVSFGIHLDFGTHGTIVSNNKFYQTAARTLTSTSFSHRAIRINNSAGGNFQVTGNTIGFANSNGNGTYTLINQTGGNFTPIAIVVGNTISSSIQGNTIAGIAMSGSGGGEIFTGILSSGLTTIGDVEGNTIGSQSTNGSITCSSSSSGGILVRGIHMTGNGDNITMNNTIGGVSASSSSWYASIYAIECTLFSLANWTCSNNTVGGSVSNSIQSTATSLATSVIGIYHHPGGSNTTTMTGNVIRNLSSNGGGIYNSNSFVCSGILASPAFGNHTISQNTINNITTTGANSILSGIKIGNGNVCNILENTISGLSASGSTAPVINGIEVIGGSVVHIAKNKIYNLLISSPVSSVSSKVNGLLISSNFNNVGAEYVTISNNLIGDLRATTANLDDAIRGISTNTLESSSFILVYYNSVYLNASSSGSNFGTSGIYHLANATGTTGNLDLRNNIIVNHSTANGSGLSVACRRSNPALDNYASTSNNNLLYAGITAPPHFIYHDGSSGLQMEAFKVHVAPRESASFTEVVSPAPGTFFQSLVGSDSSFLHIVTGLTSQIEGGAANIATYTDDYDGHIRFGNPGYEGTGIAPDVGADEFEGVIPSAMMYISSTTTQNNTTDVLTNTINQEVLGIQIVTSGPLIPLAATSFTFNTNGTSSLDDIANAKLFYTVSSPVFNPTSQFGSVIPAPNGSFTITGSSQNLCDGVNYFWLTYDILCLATNANVIDAECTAITVETEQIPTTQAPAGNRTINSSLNGIYTIGTGGDYSSLTAAANDVNLVGLNNHVTFHILENLVESGAISFNQWLECGGSDYSITIKPAPSVSAIVSSSSSTAVMIFNGADRVILDGSNNGTNSKDMLIRNTGTGSALRFINGSTFNMIQNMILESQNTSLSSGTVLFSTSSGITGNSHNTIMNCDIRDRSDVTGVPANAIYSNGSSGALNANNGIQNCNVFNFTNAGLFVASTGAGDGWTVNPSNFYQTANRTSSLTAIIISGGSGHSIWNNSIGGSAPDRSGSPIMTTGTFTGISLSVGVAASTTVQGNSISNLNISGGSNQTFRGIYVTSGNVNIGTVAGNVIGGGSIASDTIRTSHNTDLIENSGSGMVTIENNIIGNIANYNPTTTRLFGIRGLAGTIIIRNNVVRNLITFSTSTAFSTFPGGIWLATTVPGATVEGNQIYDIAHSHTGTSAYTVAGIYIAGVSSTGTPTTITKNHIYNITAAGTGVWINSPRIWGIHIAFGSATYSNNMIALGANVSNETRIHGIQDLMQGTNKYYFNTISISGTDSTGANSSYAFRRSSLSTVTILNNIFTNTRTGGTGFHVAIANTNTSTIGWPSNASNYNCLYSSDPTQLAQWLGSAMSNNRTFVEWQAAQNATPPGSGGDINSINVAPLFVSNSDLHLTPANGSLDNYGTPAGGILTDIDGDGRSLFTPDIGADEFLSDCSTMVLSPNDSGTGSLRDVINCAPAGSTIHFSPSLMNQTITLTSGEIVINKNLILAGPGMASLTLSGDLNSRIFNIISDIDFQIKSMSLKNGNASVQGGAMLLAGNLTLRNVLMQNNFENMTTPIAMTVTGSATVDINESVEFRE